MTTLIKYVGATPISELSITGKPGTWQPGEIQSRTDADAALFQASGMWKTASASSLFPDGSVPLSAAINGDGVLEFTGGLIGTKRMGIGFLCDSLGMGGVAVQAQQFLGLKKPWWISTSVVNTALGGGTWLGGAMVDGFAPAGASGTLRTDGAGNLQWMYAGDAYGPLVDVRAGGFFVLQSATSPFGCWVYVRGGTAFPTVAGTGAVTTAGNPGVCDYTLYGFTAWVAGMLGDAFPSYDHSAINGSTSTDVLLRADQALSRDYDAIVILIGTNDAPTSADAAVALASRICAIIDKAVVRANRVYVGDVWINATYSSDQLKWMALACKKVAAYCAKTSKAKFWSAYDLLVSQTGLPTTQRPGAFNTTETPPGVHLLPWGAYLAASRLVDMIRSDFRLPVTSSRRAGNELFDATFGTGAWNSNPTLRGTGGTLVGTPGVTGTCPDGSRFSRSGGDQVCTTSFENAPDGGMPFFAMSVSGNSVAGSYHELAFSGGDANGFLLPAGISVGDSYRIVCELCVYGVTDPGLAIFSVAATHPQANGTSQVDTLMTLATRPLATFTTENPILRLSSSPCVLDSVSGKWILRVRIGAATGGGAAKIGIRELKVEKVIS